LTEWDPEDRAKALALFVEESQRCQMCGTAEWEWEENPHAYEPIGKMCHGCYLKDTVQEDSKNLPGTTIVLEASAAITPEMREHRMKWQRKLSKDEHSRR